MAIMRIVSLFTASIALLMFIAFQEGLQAGTLYDCRDQNGSIILSDTPLVKGYSCKALESYKDITDEDRKSWEEERRLSREKWEKSQAQEAKERIERQGKEAEAAKEKRADEALQASQKAADDEAALRASGYQLGIPNIPPPSDTGVTR